MLRWAAKSWVLVRWTGLGGANVRLLGQWGMCGVKGMLRRRNGVLLVSGVDCCAAWTAGVCCWVRVVSGGWRNRESEDRNAQSLARSWNRWPGLTGDTESTATKTTTRGTAEAVVEDSTTKVYRGLLPAPISSSSLLSSPSLSSSSLSSSLSSSSSLSPSSSSPSPSSSLA